ncbi:hypothetical protein TanjilG_06121 [Lupinus angustifolius]|uniref:H15 domain-containing protein n=1 Tax=Lupinus angustifolius TaxID=3871 RepID=A0A1J7GT64_LUPAN|nr:PREDICTED: uncharacterized protein LOC109358509 [Lupinus angustifolius]OIW03612.1 hypothetical protein TanjilG_06121 [Lupinus angustifolius]
MDPSSIPPPLPPTNVTVPAAVPFTDEPNNNHPPPPIPSPPTFTHPSYADMIYRAIEALKEKDGSSKRAIAKYIEEVYKDQLPPTSTHTTLLTQHLKRLKDNGLLQMVKKSYILPRSVPPLPQTQQSESLPAQPSRPRGRPRKIQVQEQDQPQAQLQVHQIVPFPVQTDNVVGQQNAEPVWAALGLSDEPQVQPVPVQDVVVESGVRRPGRPRKSVVGSGVGSVGPEVKTTVSPGRRGRPPGSKNKKKPGRPAKTEASAAVVSSAAASSGVKRRPGRPPKNQQATPIPFASAAEAEVPVAVAGVDVPVAVAGGDVPVVEGTKRTRGRPKKIAGAPATPVGGGVGSGRGRGRGRGRGGARGRGAGSRSSFGRPVGRPRKGTTSVSTSQNVAEHEYLKRKLEHFQSKVKESLEVLKPHFTHESPVSAIAAIQDLEVLGSMDLNAPLEDETFQQQHQQPPQQQPPPPPPPQQQPQQLLQPPPQLPQVTQQQLYPHQFPQFQQPYQPQQQQFPNQYQQPPQQFQPQLPHHRMFNP